MDKYYILKGKLRCESSNFYSVFLIMIDQELKILEKVEVNVTRIPTFYNNSNTLEWYEVEEQILQDVFDGKNISTLSKSIQQGIEKIFINEDIDYLVDLVGDEFDKFQKIIDESIGRTLGTEDLAIEMHKFESNSIVQPTNENDNITSDMLDIENESIEFDIPADVNLIPVKPVLGPVSGIPIYELTEGDKIYVNIDTNFNRAKEYLEYFNAIQGDKLLPVRAEIMEIFIDMTNNYVILVKLDDTTYGRITEEEKIKIRKVEEEDIVLSMQNKKNLANIKNNQQTNKKQKSNNTPIIILFGVVILIIVIFIILFFI